MSSRKKQSAKSSPAPAHYDLDQVRAYARHRWPEILQALCGISPDALTGEHCPCPRCGGTDRFRFSDMDGNGSAICNQCLKDAGDGFAVVQHYTGKKFAEVLAMVAEYLGIAPSERQASGKSYNRNTPADPAESLEFIPWDAEFEGNDMQARIWCTWKRPVSLAAIKAVGGLIAKHQGIEVIAIPVWGESLDAAPPVGYVLYNLTGGPLPRKAKNKETGRWEVVEELKVKLAAGSKPGIICDLARLRSARVVAKVEGPSDCLGLLSLDDLPDDVCPLTTANGAGEKPAAWMLDLLAGPEDNRHDAAWVIHDADLPGQSGATGYTDEKTGSFRPGWCNYLAPLLPTKNIALPFEVVDTHGQDLRDFLTCGSPDDAPLVASYVDLLALVENSEVIPAGESPLPPLDQSTPPIAKVLEAEDDPHRLARVNLDRYAAATNGGTIRYWRDEWFTWKPDRACYRKIAENELRAKIGESIKSEFDRINLIEQQSSEDETPPNTRKVTKTIVTNVMNATGTSQIVPYSVEPMTWIGADGKRARHNYVAMKNGVLDLDRLLADEDDCILPHSPNWFSMVRLPYSYDPEATCPKFDAFLEKNLQMDPERIKILQEWAGYLLLPDTGERRFLVLEGEGRNGKSVYMAAVTAMLGVENCSFVPLESFNRPFDKSSTIGKLVNVCTDVGEIDKVAEGSIKAFTSGDVVFFDRKGVTPIECLPTARLMMAWNNRPRFSDRSSAIWDRMLLIPWLVRIEDHEIVRNMDKGWWWEKAGELPGIFNWAIEGLHRLRNQNGFTKSEMVRQSVEEYRDDANPVRIFIKENFEPSDSAVRTSAAYHFYCRWAEQNGFRPVNERNFGKEVFGIFKKNGIERKRGRTPGGERYWFYHGIGFSCEEIYGEKTSDDLLF